MVKKYGKYANKRWESMPCGEEYYVRRCDTAEKNEGQVVILYSDRM